MKRTLTAAPLLLVFAFAGEGLYGQEATHGMSRAARTFEQSCASCHVVPDARFGTDRAWLTQLQDTA